MILFFIAFPAWAAKDKVACIDKELVRADCHLYVGSYDVRLLAKTVAWTDGTWHTVDPMPMKGAAVAWEKITLEMMSGHPILQFWLWDKGEGESQIQSLHWFVAAAEKQKFTVLAEGIVRKRRPEAPPVAAPAGGKTVQAKFLYDDWEVFGLKAGKNGELEWHLRDVKKILATKQVKHGV